MTSLPAAPDPGLCASCRHSTVIAGARSQFWMCRLSATDPSFARYPRLPILECRGYERVAPDDGGAAPGNSATPGSGGPTSEAAPEAPPP
jgi:hypothetical protein